MNYECCGYIPKENLCRIVLTRPDAIMPSKAHDTDIGYDLSIISLYKRISDTVSLYDTGIQVHPNTGYYAQIYSRSSLPTKGYILANGVGIIDPSYRGNIYVALMKIDPEAESITFPFRCCQLVFSRAVNVNLVQVQELDATERGAGGFGSSG